MKRFVFLVIATLGLGALAGCSVFGIATKGELEAAMAQEAASTRELEARLAALDDQLAAARSDLAALDGAVAGNTQRVDDATRQWHDLQATMTSHLDSLQTEMTLVERDVAIVRDGMTVATAQAAMADAKSRRAMQVHFENLTLERQRLQQRLLELDRSLDAWPAVMDSLPAATGGVANASRYDQRIVPEKPADGASAGAGGS